MTKKRIVLFAVAISLVVIAIFTLVILINVPYKSFTLLKTYVIDEKTCAANTVRATTDGGYIVSGGISTFDTTINGWRGTGSFLVKVNSSLNPQWSKTFTFDDFWAIPIESGFAVLGSSYECFYLIKLDDNGNVLWSKKYTGLGSLSSSAFQKKRFFIETSDNGFIVSGSFLKFSNDSKTRKEGALIVKFDGSGDIQWAKTYENDNSIGPASIQSFAIKELPNKHFIVAMSIQDAALFSGGGGIWGTANDFLIMEIDSNGNVVYTRRVGRSKTNEVPTSIILNANGGCTVVGCGLTVTTEESGSTNAAKDIPLVQLDNTGNVISCKTYGINNKYANCSYADATPDGGYIVANDILLKLDKNGKVVWAKGNDDYAVSFVKRSNDGYIATGNSGLLFPPYSGKNAKGNFFTIEFKNNDLNKAIFKNVDVEAGTLHPDINTSINLEVSDIDVKSISVSSVKVKIGKIKFKEINTIN
jgi:hypothetical protein